MGQVDAPILRSNVHMHHSVVGFNAQLFEDFGVMKVVIAFEPENSTAAVDEIPELGENLFVQVLPERKIPNEQVKYISEQPKMSNLVVAP